MNTISTTKLCQRIGLQIPVFFLKSIGIKPAHELHGGWAMWNEDDVDRIIMDIGIHFINKANAESSLLAPYGYKKNGDPAKKRGKPSRLQVLMEKTK